MRIIAAFILVITTTLLGAGCFEKPRPYVQALPDEETITVAPTKEGGEASTGGQTDVTITPKLETQSIADAMPTPDALNGFSASTPVESTSPVPMPDGTRTDFPTVTVTFSRQDADAIRIIEVSLTDTRSIPVLTAFLSSYSAYENERGHRTPVEIAGETGWVTYTKTPDDTNRGFGALTMLYRGRFLIQINGNAGITEEDLVRTAKAFRFETLQ